MDMKGEYRIPAPRQKVWEALNDPEILKASIPGCESLEKTSENEMTAAVTAKVGPVKAKFKGDVRLENINPPEGYSIVGEGKGGVAGFAKGGADVHLAEDGDGTILTYEAKAQVGGKLAQLGSRLIDSTARKMADEFFGNFSRIVGGETGDGSPAGATPEAQPTPAPAAPEPVAAPDAASAHAASMATGAMPGTAAAPTRSDGGVEDTIRDAEERLEVEAGKGTLGGPMVWGLIALAVLIVIILIANM